MSFHLLFSYGPGKAEYEYEHEHEKQINGKCLTRKDFAFRARARARARTRLFRAFFEKVNGIAPGAPPRPRFLISFPLSL